MLNLKRINIGLYVSKFFLHVSINYLPNSLSNLYPVFVLIATGMADASCRQTGCHKVLAGNKKGIFRDFGQSITFLFLYIEASKSTCMFTLVCAICVCKRKLQGCSILKLVVRVVFTFSDKYGDMTKTIPDD